ncbi:hypothetical protein ACFSFY_16245 [Sporosarcina siberiensis]|uniref:ABC-2 family transporter protein n=1 Tax=Sporosarcina siberiensis TaxID=1365606 RepID=A0ABW4SMC7_9BACL
MSRLKTIVRTESLLLLRNKFLAIPLLINVLCWSYIVIAYEMEAIHFEVRAAVFYNGFMWMLLLNLLIVGLFSVYMAGKDRESEFEHLVVTYRVTNVEWITGKWVVAQLYGLCITLITLLIQVGWFFGGKMAFGEVAQNAFYVFIQMEGAFFLLVSLGFLFGSMVRNVFSYLFIPTFLVLTLGLPFDYTGVAADYDNPKLHLLTPFDYMFIQSPFEGIWGIDRVFEPTILHQGIVFLFGIVVLLVTLLLFHRNRRKYREKRMIPVVIVGLLIPVLVLSGFSYMQYERAYEQFIITGDRYAKEFEGDTQTELFKWENDYYDENLDDEPYELSMVTTNLDVKLKDDDQMSVQSNLTIKNNGELPTQEVYLTLVSGLSVTVCKSEIGITCSRMDDFIVVELDKPIESGEEFNINLDYEGTVLQYRNDAYTELAFIQENRVSLPKEAGWYPLIGKRSLVIGRKHNNRFTQFELRNAKLVEDFPTAFSVTISNENSEIPLALTIPEVKAGVYEGTSQYGLSLMGGNLKEMIIDDIRVVGHPEVLNGAQDLIGRYKPLWDFTEDWLEVSVTPSVIYLLDTQHYYLMNNTRSHGFLTLNSDYLEEDRDDVIAYEVLKELMGMSSISSRLNSQEDDFDFLFNAMLWTMLKQLGNEMEFKEWYGEYRLMDDRSLSLVNLLHGYEEQGIEAFNEVLNYLFQYVVQLDDQQEFDMVDALKLYESSTVK